MDSRWEIDARGTKKWFNEEGKLHRLDGPAVEWADGDMSWWINGKQHRLDGPAVVWINGYKEWWIDDIKLSQKQFKRHPLVVLYRLSLEHR
jgi:hypothetical protein